MDLAKLRKRLVTACACLVITSAACKADVVMVQHGKQSGRVSGTWTRTVRIKGLKMRIDRTENGETRVILYDLEAGKKFLFNPKRKEVSAVDLKFASEQMKSDLVPERLRRTIRATGKKAEIAGVSCDEYAFDLQVPLTPLRRNAVQHESGTACVSQTLLEGVEVANFLHEANKRGFTAAAAALSPSLSLVGFYFYGEEPNVLVLAANTESAVEGQLMETRAATRMEQTVSVSDIKSSPILDEDFLIPADWKLVKGKE
jgi:hypothetical protein